MATIFSKIINGEIPSYKVAESDEFLAFLDINPLVMGHTLVVPKVEVDYIFNLDDDLLSRLMVFSKKVVHAMDLCIECDRIGVTVIGLEVAHAHIHLIPIKSVSDMNFSKAKLSPTVEDMKEIAARISAKFI
jgi:histidine triad (HIT) family protein